MHLIPQKMVFNYMEFGGSSVFDDTTPIEKDKKTRDELDEERAESLDESRDELDEERENSIDRTCDRSCDLTWQADNDVSSAASNDNELISTDSSIFSAFLIEFFICITISFWFLGTQLNTFSFSAKNISYESNQSSNSNSFLERTVSETEHNAHVEKVSNQQIQLLIQMNVSLSIQIKVQVLIQMEMK